MVKPVPGAITILSSLTELLFLQHIEAILSICKQVWVMMGITHLFGHPLCASITVSRLDYTQSSRQLQSEQQYLLILTTRVVFEVDLHLLR